MDIQALSSKDRSLLPLGYHLASLPVDVRVGKTLIYGAIFKCWEPVCTIAALSSSRSVFLSPPSKREEARQAQKTFHVRGSDHLTLLNVYRSFVKERDRRRFCAQHFLRHETLISVRVMIKQFERAIRQLGIELSNENSHKLPMIKAALCAGLNVVKAVAPEQRYQHLQGTGNAIAIDPSAREIRFFCKGYDDEEDRNDSIPRQRVFMHPSSVNFQEGKFPYQYLIYQEKVKTSKIFLRSTSTLPPYALLLCWGSELEVKYDGENTMVEISVEKWIRFETPARVAAIVKELRILLSELLRRKIANPRLNIGNSPLITAMSKLLMASGM